MNVIKKYNPIAKIQITGCEPAVILKLIDTALNIKTNTRQHLNLNS